MPISALHDSLSRWASMVVPSLQCEGMISSRVPVTIPSHFLRGLLMAIQDLKVLVHTKEFDNGSWLKVNLHELPFNHILHIWEGGRVGTWDTEIRIYYVGIFDSKNATNEYTVLYK